MKEIGKAETIYQYEQQIDYLDSILATLEDLQILYAKNKSFDEDYKEVKNKINYLDGVKQELMNEKEELLQKEIEENDKELEAMNYDFERSRL